MADVIAIVRAAAPTSTGNTNITTADLGGQTPKGVLVIATHADTDATAEDGLAMGIGFADATTENFVGISSQHGVTTSNTDRNYDVANLIDLLVDGAVTVTGTFVAFIEDGITINFTVVEASTPSLLTYIFFAGDDVAVHVAAVDLGTGTTALNQTAPGFLPEIVFVAGTAQGNVGVETEARIHFGAAVNDGSDTNRGILWESVNDAATSLVHSVLNTDSVGGDLVEGVVGWEVTVDDFDTSGFSLTPSADTDQEDIIYMAVKFGSLSASIRSFDSPTSTGNDARTGVGFTPQFVLLGMTDAQAEDVVENDADAGGFGISVFTADAEISNSWADEDAQTTTDNQSLTDNQAINFASGDGVTQHAATFVTLDADGHTLNYSVADGTARKWFEIAIGAAAAGANPHNPLGHPLMGPFAGPIS